MKFPYRKEPSTHGAVPDFLLSFHFFYFARKVLVGGEDLPEFDEGADGEEVHLHGRVR